MSKQYPGGLIIKNPVTPSGPYQTSTASGIWTLDQQAYWASQSLWPTAGRFPTEPYFNYVTMLLHGNSAASEVLPFNSDASTNNFQVTQVGDTRPSNYTPFITDGYWSNLLPNTTGSCLRFGTSTNLALGSGSFTVEMWVYINSLASAGYSTILDWRTNGNTPVNIPLLGDNNNTGKLSFVYGTGGGWAQILESSTTMPLNAWTHIALVRSGTTVTLYFNGTSVASATSSVNFGNETLSLGQPQTTGAYTPNAYFSNVRIVKGSAVYTGAFTPPTTPLTAITNTQLLTCQSNRFVDNSSNNFTVTIATTPSVQAFQPFTSQILYSNGYAGYFDGTGDYLTVADNAALELLASDFTIECWVYPTGGSGTDRSLVTKRSSGSVYGGYGLFINTSNNCGFIADNDTSAPWPVLITGSTVALNEWTHLAATRSGSTWTVWKNGVSVGTATASITINDAATTTSIGAIENGDQPFTGYITNARIVKGTAVYTSAFTPPTTPLTAITNTSLLTVQTNAPSQNNTFLDSSTNNYVVTRYGNTTQGTFTPYGSNWSNTFASGSYFTFPDSTAFNLSGGVFTIECWVKPDGNYSNYNTLIAKRTGDTSGTFGWELYLRISTGVVSFATNAAGVESSSTPTAGVWSHIAAVYDGTNINLYLNGTRVAQGALSNNNVSAPIYVGSYPTYSEQFLGFVSNMRVTKGGALYSGTSFTVPTSPLTTSVSAGTVSLLTCQSNRFIDTSANAVIPTVTGSPSVQRISPFAPANFYSTSVIGGSGYFDGSGDYLTATAPNLTGTWTVELWWYPLGVSSQQTFLSFNAGSYSGINMWCNSSGQLVVDDGVNGQSAFTTVTFKANQWNHIAIVRSGTTTTGYINGMAAGSNSFTPATTNTIMVGRYNNSPYFYVSGYFSDIRVVNGTAVYTSAFTPPAAPLTPITNTALLLSYTNAGIFDNSMMNDLETIGNAQISTAVKKYGTGSMYFDGSGDYLKTLLNQSVNFGTNSFTIEMWVNPSTTNHQSACLFSQEHIAASNTPISICIYLNGGSYEAVGNGLGWGIYSGGAWQVAQFNLATIAINTWTFIALVRNGNVFTMYVNGTSVGSVTNSSSCSAGSTPYFIGRRWDTYGSYPYYNGYIDDFRLTLGVARYTSNFTPPTSQFIDQ